MITNKKTTIFLIIFSNFFIFNNVFSQFGGKNVYSFLDLSNSARIMALGGKSVPIRDNDISLAYSNPSLLTKEMHNNFVLSFVNYYAGINYGMASISKCYNKYGNFLVGINYVNYGNFDEYDDSGEKLGSFSSSEYAFNFSWSKELDSNFIIGSTIKPIFSNLYKNKSYGIVADISTSYNNSKRRITASLLFRNIGRQIKSYNDKNENLPFQIELGFSKKLLHVPFRYIIVLQHIEKFDLTYSNPQTEKSTTNTIKADSTKESSWDKISDFADKASRHIVIGGEFTPAKFLFFRLGLNYMLRKEMLIDSKPSTVGISWGIGLKIKKINISYSRSRYHLYGSPNSISISTKI